MIYVNKKKIYSLLVLCFLGMALLIGQSRVTADQTVDSEIKNISTQNLSERLTDREYVIVDVRSEAAYIGWRLAGEKRGGHIRGAVDFPKSWASNLKGDKLKNLLTQKGITPNKTIVFYGYNREESILIANILKNLGYQKVMVYEGGIQEWAANDNLPMDRLARYTKLVYPEWVQQVIQGETPESYTNTKFKIFEVSWGAPKEYNAGHIPGAFHLDTNEIEEEPLWNRVSDQDLEEMLLRNGVTSDTTVIVYGSDSTAAARAASIFMYAGVEDVRLLNGGFQAWKATGLEVEKIAHTPTPVKAFGVQIPAHPEYIIDIEEAKEILATKNGNLVSIRSWVEYLGETSGYSYIKPKGRIPGAAWGHAGSDPYHMEDYRNINGTMRNYHEIATNWEDWGITSDQSVSFYCGTGWRASEAFFDAFLMGWDQISVFDGGWYEWSMDKANPITSGEPDKK